MKNIQNRLKRYRKVRGLKQKEVAALLGVKNAAMISRWEKGTALPNTLNVFKLALIYRTMVDALYIDLISAMKDELQAKE